MSTLTITLNLNNAAFADNPDELPAVLARVAERVAATPRARWGSAGSVADTNGNTVGVWTVEEDTDE